MAILIANDGDKVVATMGARDAISKKFNGMEVTVLDAIADVAVGTGAAGYKWVEAQNKWVLTWKTTKDNLAFTTDVGILANGKITASHPPKNRIVWDCVVLYDNGIIVADVTPDVNGTQIDIGSTDYDGLTLSITYGYGIQEASTAMYGEIRLYAGASVPYGWLPCAGQLLSITDYPELFSVLGATYGGDGMATFALPSYRYSGTGPRRIISVDYHVPQPVLQVPVIAAIHGPVPGYYKAGTVLPFTVQLLEGVTVSGGPVSLSIDIGGVAHSLAFVSGTATNWIFSDYTVQSGDIGDVTATLNLNAATLTTTNGSYPAALSVNSMLSGVIVDTSAPAITISNIGIVSDTGVSAVDFITSTSSQTITATLSAALAAGDSLLASVDSGTTWTNILPDITAVAWTAALLSGTHAIQFKVRDQAGNEGSVASQSYTLDTSTPSAPTMGLGVSSGANVGTFDIIILDGGVTWQYSSDNGVTWTTGTGTSSFTLAAGTYTAGSVLIKSAITKYMSLPATPTIYGEARVGAGEVLTVSVNGIVYTAGAGNLVLSGTRWYLTIPAGNALAAGTYNVIATVTDTAGNKSNAIANKLTIIG